MMLAKQTMLAAVSLLSAVQAVPLAAGTKLIAPFGFADCMTNGDNWVEYEDWVASAGERDAMGVVVEDGVDASGVHYNKVLSDHCNAVLTSAKPVICLKDEGSVKVVNDVSHLSNVKKLCKAHAASLVATPNDDPTPAPTVTPTAAPGPDTSVVVTSGKCSTPLTKEQCNAAAFARVDDKAMRFTPPTQNFPNGCFVLSNWYGHPQAVFWKETSNAGLDLACTAGYAPCLCA